MACALEADCRSNLRLGPLFTSSLLVWPQWIPGVAADIFGYRQYSAPPLVSYLLGTQMGSRFGPILIAALLGGALAVAWRLRHASPNSIEFRIGHQRNSLYHGHHYLAGRRCLRPRCAIAWSNPDRLDLARLYGQSFFSRHSYHHGISFVLAMD